MKKFFNYLSNSGIRNNFQTKQLNYLRAVTTRFLFCLIVGLMTLPGILQAQVIRDITFPINGKYQPFGDSFGDPRSGGRSHEGIDILADKMTPLVAAVDGVVTFAPPSEPYWGYALHIRDDDGWEYRYLHINNDTPGTDDNSGGFQYAFAPGIKKGMQVTQGQLVSYVGDSGNAEWVVAHLHFEIHKPGGWSGAAINPYPSLQAALNGSVDRIDYNPEVAAQAAPSISIDKRLEPPVFGPVPCNTDTLVKSSASDAVYYCGADRKRYVFPNDKVYFTWYDDFSEVIEVTAEELASIPLGGNATYRPGVKLIKITTDPKVYAVDRGGVLRWMKSPSIAQELYGADWAKQVDDVSDAFFVNYTIGEPIG